MYCSNISSFVLVALLYHVVSIAVAAPTHSLVADQHIPSNSASANHLNQPKLTTSQRYGYQGSGDCGKSEDDKSDREWVDDQYDDLDFDPEGPGEIGTGISRPGEIGTVSDINDEARAVTRLQFPGPGGHNDEADAFRHAYFNARLTQELGADRAKAWGDAHEVSNPNEVEERIMDLTNNRAGRQIGDDNAGSTPAEIAQAVKDAISKGDSGILTSPPKCGGDSKAEGDPHLTGFDGSRFDFHGVDKHHYLLFGRRSGDVLVTKMRQDGMQSKRKIKRTFFDSLGLQVGGTELRVQVSLERSNGRNWKQIVRLNDRVLDSSYLGDSVRINMREGGTTITTAEHIFKFTTRFLSTKRRHQNVGITLKQSPISSHEYLGILGVTLDRAIGKTVHADFRTMKKRSVNLEMALRRRFELQSLFPPTKKEGKGEIEASTRVAVSAFSAPGINGVRLTAKVEC